MRYALLVGTALFFGLGAASAGVCAASQVTFARPAMHEGRAVAPDAAYRRHTDNGYHDPRFSLQQDEIYSQRF